MTGGDVTCLGTQQAGGRSWSGGWGDYCSRILLLSNHGSEIELGPLLLSFSTVPSSPASHKFLFIHPLKQSFSEVDLMTSLSHLKHFHQLAFI